MKDDNKLILKKITDWGSKDTAIRVPDELVEKIKDIAAEINSTTKQVTAELIAFALSNYTIVD